MSSVPELNEVRIAGRISKEPRRKQSQRGIVVAEISLQMRKTKTRQDADGETVKHVTVTYVIVEFWDRPAQRLLALDLKQGAGLKIEGCLWLQVLKTGPRLIVLGNKYEVIDTDDVYEPDEETT